MEFSETQLTYLQVIEAISACMSASACVFILTKLWHSWMKGPLHMIDWLLGMLLVIDWILAMTFGVGVSANGSHEYCQLQAFIIQWFGVAGMLWNSTLSFMLFKWIVLKKHPNRIKKRLLRYAFAIFLVSFILALSLLGFDVFGEAGAWCFYTFNSRGNEASFICFYFILGITWTFSIIMLLSTSNSVRKRLNTTSQDMTLSNAENTIQAKLRQYIIIFVSTWFFTLLNRLVMTIYGHPVFTTTVLAALFVPLQGFLNASSYGGLFDCKSGRSDEEAIKITLAGSPGDANSLNFRRHRILSPLVYVPKKYSVFTSTLNMGEAETEAILENLKDWLVIGHDIYAIGVQECIDIKGLRDAMLEHLGGAEEYSMFTSEIGSNNTKLGYHGFIALTAFVKKDDIRRGHIRFTDSASRTMATGTNLLVATAQNKGAVGLMFQVHDTSIGFVTAHLPSDSKGKSKLWKRNASIDAILREVVLAPEDTGFDMQLQHDHVIILGDLNYRMDRKRVKSAESSILQDVANAATIEKVAMGNDPDWLQKRYSLLRAPNDPLYPDPDELSRIRGAQEVAKNAWEVVLAADELRLIMKYGDAFCGFQEPLPAFPPSYKRKKGRLEGDCGDYTDPIDILSGFTNTGEMDLAEAATSNRVSLGSSNLLKEKLAALNSLHSQGDGDGSDGVDGMIEMSHSVDRTNEDEEKTSSGDRDGQQPPPVSEVSIVVGKLSEYNAHSRGAAVGGGGRDVRKERPLSKRRQSTLVSITPQTKKDIKKLRPPSYTDRILVHSLAEKEDKIEVQGYDFCDTVRVSDHRAVVMALQLEANSAVKFPVPEEASESNSSKVRNGDVESGGGEQKSDGPKIRLGQDIEVYELSITQLQVLLQGLINRSSTDPYRTFLPNHPALYLPTHRIAQVLIESNDSNAEPESQDSLLSFARLSNALNPLMRTSFTEGEADGGDDSSRTGRPGGAATAASAVKSRGQRARGGTRGSSLRPPGEDRQDGEEDEDEDDDYDDHHGDEEEGRGGGGLQSQGPSQPNVLNRGIEVKRSMTSSSLATSSSDGSTDSSVTTRGSNLSRVMALAGIDSSPKKPQTERDKWRVRDESKNQVVKSVTTVFPLPEKDPLIAHRKIYDFAQAFQLDSTALISSFKRVVEEAAGDDDEKTSSDAFLKITTSCSWEESDVNASHQPGAIPVSQTNKRSIKIFGCVSPELGAHAMLKFLNSEGEDLGSCVICLSSLMTRNLDKPKATAFRTAQLTTGGKNRGHITGNFSLRILATATTGS